MGLSNVYGPANDEESKEVLRHAIEIGVVSTTKLYLTLFYDLLVVKTFWDTWVPTRYSSSNSGLTHFQRGHVLRGS